MSVFDICMHFNTLKWHTHDNKEMSQFDAYMTSNISMTKDDMNIISI